MELIALPAFSDNYIWMLHDGQRAIVVDPGDSTPVLEALDSRSLALSGILVTHHHDDHAGGVDALRAVLRGPVYGPARESIPKPFIPLRDGEVAAFPEVGRDELPGGLRFQVIDVPGHTAGHVAYVCPQADALRRPPPDGNEETSGGRAFPQDAAMPAPQPPILFCGDTLFSGGCGRLFEGTPEQMHASLTRLAALPADTRVCCAHEYTLSNLRFAQAVEPANDDLASYVEACERLRAKGVPTLPSSIGQERRVNPFLRCGEPAVVQSARLHGAASDAGTEVFAALRRWKNDFR